VGTSARRRARRCYAVTRRPRADLASADPQAGTGLGVMSAIEHLPAGSGFEAAPRRLSLVTPPSSGSTWRGSDAEDIDLKLSFRQLTLIHKALHAVKTLGALPPQDELLNDTLHLVDLTLDRAV
jgi:hypothetical protein